MPTYGDDHERSAAGMDYDFPNSERASAQGGKGPAALFEEIENLVPEPWREQIARHPIAAILVGFGVGIWLGARKGDEIVAAGTAFATTAAMAGVNQVLDRFGVPATG